MTTPITGQGLNVCIPPDDELSLTSKKAAQNKVITEELTDLSNAISQKAPVIINTASGDIATFADGADGMQIQKIVGTIATPEGGSGYTEAVITRTGKNLMADTESEFVLRQINNGSAQRTIAIRAFNGETFWWSRNNNGPIYISAWWCDEISSNITATKIRDLGGYNNTGWVNTDNHKYLLISYPPNYVMSVFTYMEGQLEIGTAKTKYEKYKPVQNLSINWQSEAGAILNGTVTLNEDGSADVVNSDTADTYHLTNVGSLSTLYGYNNIWIDTGSITECDYPADTKLYIDGLTAPDEDMIADANIASGKYFVVNNQLYLSTAAIAAGASIVPGTNCTATNLAEALNALNT